MERSSASKHPDAQPLLKKTSDAVFQQSEFLAQVVCDFLDARSIALLRDSCSEFYEQVGHASHVQILVRERSEQLPGLAQLASHGIVRVSSLSDLHIAENAVMEAVLCIFGFASTEPDFDEQTVSTMKQFAKLVQRFPQTKLQVVGHGQPGAPEPLASNLAKRRAKNVADEFQRSHGLTLDRILLTHCSNRQPRFSDPEKNRRVELSIVGSNSSVKANKAGRRSSCSRLGFGLA